MKCAALLRVKVSMSAPSAREKATMFVISTKPDEVGRTEKSINSVNIKIYPFVTLWVTPPLSKGRLVATFLSFRLSPTKSGARRNLSTKQEIMNRFLHSLSLGRNDVSFKK